MARGKAQLFARIRELEEENARLRGMVQYAKLDLQRILSAAEDTLRYLRSGVREGADGG